MTTEIHKSGIIRQALIRKLKATKVLSPSTWKIIEEALAELYGANVPTAAPRLAFEEVLNLFRAGLVSFGKGPGDIDFSLFYLTRLGMGIDAEMARDPYNQTGYLSDIGRTLADSQAALSYVTEGVAALNSGLYRAAAVLLGVSAECLLLELRDALVNYLTIATGKIPKRLAEEDHVKQVDELVETELKALKSRMGPQLSDRFVTYWKHIAPIRIARNAAGHPNDISAISASASHGNYLYFHEVARLLCDLRNWITAMADSPDSSP